MDDDIPRLVDEFARVLTQVSEDNLPDEKDLAISYLHGMQRLRHGFDIEEVVAEYNILRCAIHAVSEEHELPITGRAFHILSRLLDSGVAAAVRAYAQHRALDLKKSHDEHLAFIAHDLRTPLHAIALAVHVLEQAGSGPVEPAQARMLKTLRRNVDSLQRLVSSVVERETDLRPDAKLAVERRHVDLWPIVEELMQDVQPLASANGTELRNAVPDDIVVFADAILLGRIVQNLLANAIRATPNGHVSVGARTVDSGGSVECSVEDDGSGITPEQIRRITEQFERADADAGASNLGLAIVNRFVRAHGGTVTIESKVGGGTTIRFTLPEASS